MEGSETGCGRVWTGGEDGRRRERDGVWTSVDGGEDGRWRERDWVWSVVGGWKMEGSETVWTVVWMEDGVERG